jgi:hypothetical protein
MPIEVAEQYSLGPVTSLTKQVAYILGPMFGIKTIHGWRASDPFPDHPSGHALDFMVPNKEVGDRLVAFATRNAKALGIKYIVWYRRSWNPQRGTWVPYTSTNNPHTDHVHITFLDKNDGTPLTDFASGFVSGLESLNPVETATDVVEALAPLTVMGMRLTSVVFWRRIGMGALGIGFIIIGLVFINRRKIEGIAKNVGGAISNIASTAVQGAAFGAGAGVTGLGSATKPASSVPVTVPVKKPRPPAIEPPSNAPTTSVLPPEIYAPVSPGGTYTVYTGKAENPTEYRRPKGGSLIDIAGTRNPTPTVRKKKSKKGQFTPSVQSPMRQQPYGGQ